MFEIVSEIVARIVADVVAGTVSGAVGLLRRPGHVRSAAAPTHIATPSQMVERRVAYAGWAESLGFVQDEVRADVFRGERLGRRVRFLTGLGGANPRAPELEVEHGAPDLEAVIVLERDAPVPAHPRARTVEPVLAFDGVTRIDVTRKVVRLSLLPMTEAGALGPALDSLARALDGPREPGDSPYR